MNRVLALGFMTGVAGLLGCQGRGAASADPCANGACEGREQCELGQCGESLLGPSTITDHSDREGAFAEGATATCPYVDGELPPKEALLDDSKIPEFNRARSRRGNHDTAGGYLQDHELHRHLLSVQGALFECLDIASCYEDTQLAGGELDFEFELEPNGRVSAVSVVPSEELDLPVVRACARKSVYQARFPSWKGARMVVTYRVQIDEA